MPNPIFTVTISAVRKSERVSESIKVYSCVTLEDAKETALKIAKSTWRMSEGWTRHSTK